MEVSRRRASFAQRSKPLQQAWQSRLYGIMPPTKDTEFPNINLLSAYSVVFTFYKGLYDW
jgi:hypothetical protein